MGGAGLDEVVTSDNPPTVAYQFSGYPDPVDPIVTIPDLGLQQALGGALGIPPILNSAGQFVGLQSPIRQSQLVQLVRLNADGYHISDLRGLQYATSLQFLDLANNSLASLLVPSPSVALAPGNPGTASTPLGQVFTQLKYLDLDNNQLADLSALQVAGGIGPTQLKALTADYNAVSDLAPLSGIASLVLLSADNQPEALDKLPGSRLEGPNGSGWDRHLASILSPSSLTSDSYGACAASTGDFLVVGDPTFRFSGGSLRGAVLVYDKSTGAFLQLLLNPEASGAQFGSAIAVAGNLLIIGAKGNSGGGRVYVYDVPTLTLVATVANPGTAGDQFGSSLAIIGSRLLVGAPFANEGFTGSGAVYVYDLSSILASAGSSPVVTMIDPHWQANGHFGATLAGVGGQVAIGDPGDTVGATTGRAYLFDPATSQLVREFVNPGSAAGFGSALAASGTNVIIGAPMETVSGTANAGAAYLFDSLTGTQLQRFANPWPARADQFGFSVAGVGSDVVVGAPFSQYGSAVFVRLQHNAAANDHRPEPDRGGPVRLLCGRNGQPVRRRFARHQRRLPGAECTRIRWRRRQ